LQELLGLVRNFIGYQVDIIQAEGVFLIDDIRPGTSIAQGLAFKLPFPDDGPTGKYGPKIGARQLRVFVFFYQ
jgi:hypothetical protein